MNRRSTGHSGAGAGWRWLLVLACLLAPVQSVAATDEPVLESKSRSYRLIDDGDDQAGELVDALPLDIYVYHPGPKQKRITIVTDMGAHDFIFERGATVDFAIRHQGRLYPHRLALVEPHVWDGPDTFTLPFELGEHNTILVNSRINGSPPLRLLFDTGASISVLNQRSGKDSAVLNGATGDIVIGPVTVRNSPIIPIDYSDSLKADGVLGYNVFLGREVTIDYGRREMRIGKAGSAPRDGFRSLPFRWRGAHSLVMVGINDGQSAREIPMLIDTGSKFSVSLTNRDPLAGRIASLAGSGWSIGGSSDGGRTYSRVFTMPSVSLAGFAVANPRAEIELPGNASGLAVNILGNDFLKRFDLILDYESGVMHARPNALISAPYDPVPLSDGILASVIGLFLLAILGMLVLYWSRRRARGSRPD